MASGVIYILINPAFKDLLKIGKTTRTAEERAAEISNGTGVPSKFVVAYEDFVADCDLAERRIFKVFEQYRYGNNREFFALTLKEAIPVVMRTISQVNAEVEGQRRVEEQRRAEAQARAEERLRAEAEARAEEQLRVEAEARAEELLKVEAEARAEERLKDEAQTRAGEDIEAEEEIEVSPDEDDTLDSGLLTPPLPISERFGKASWWMLWKTYFRYPKVSWFRDEMYVVHDNYIYLNGKYFLLKDISSLQVSFMRNNERVGLLGKYRKKTYYFLEIRRKDEDEEGISYLRSRDKNLVMGLFKVLTTEV